MKKVLCLLVSIGVVLSLVLSHQVSVYKQAPLKVSDPLYRVAKGTGFHQLCADWLEKNYLDSCLPYKFYAKLYGQRVKLQTGVYDLTGLSVLEAIDKINRGQQHQFHFTIIEGERLQDVLAKLAQSPYINFDIDKNTLAQILHLPKSAEGYLLPETYAYTAEESALSILRRAKQQMEIVLKELWQTRSIDLPIKSPYEALILASIIEKETGYGPERRLIASVFINRLNTNMRLQTDPTVIYGLGDAFDGDIKHRDLRQFTPYNTYRINGLPPTPIAMPSREAIRAALNPETSDYLYFVAKGDGKHQFSKDLAAHNRAVKRYILKRHNDS